MVLGYRKKKEEVKKIVPKEVAERRLKTKIEKLSTSIKIPAPIHQFNTKLSEKDEERVLSLLSKYSPETRKEKFERVKKEKETLSNMSEEKKTDIIKSADISDEIKEEIINKKLFNGKLANRLIKHTLSAKPILLKFGARHIVDLAEQKKLKLVLIASDVVPITTFVFLPTLFKRLNVPYAIVSSKSKLGNLVNVKQAGVIGIESVRSEDEVEFENVIKLCNSIFSDRYEEHMKECGGSAARRNKLEIVE